MNKILLITLFITLLIGCQPEYSYLLNDINKKKIKAVTIQYLEDKVAFKSKNGKPFCSYKELGSTKISNSEIRYYIYGYCLEFTNKFEKGSGLKIPMALTIDLESESVKNFNMPRDNKYLEDIKKIFPNNIKIDLSNSEKAEIETEIFQRAKKYYESRSGTVN
ncbi:hypothetical protein L3V64_014210 [Geobacillus stearothermophilus]|uniref:hypothetical protein n=1 Tax=Geobacillus TaxID=129337 RepID=UPI00078DACDB|nr:MULTISPECIES: hypothetical protein [Geobacillus]AMQ21687.1 hypothetical protein A0V43_13275 [Geobacillus sp. JS12]ASS87069.1 hypothetical protein GLN3_08165 [Geobacillus lituanicus]MCK7607446.1 hypothetical protein [Geobacillus stearothermophilus]